MVAAGSHFNSSDDAFARKARKIPFDNVLFHVHTLRVTDPRR